MHGNQLLSRTTPLCFAYVILLTAAAALHAGNLTLLTSPTQFAHDSFLDWADLGPPSTRIPTPAFFIDVKDTALAARVSEAPTANIDGFQRLEHNLLDPRIGFISWSGQGFETGEQLLFTGADGINVGNMGFDFSQPVFGFGVQFEINGFADSYLTRIEAFDSDGFSLGLFDVNASSNRYPFSPTGPFSDRAKFFGIRSDVREISSILITPSVNFGMVASSPLLETGVAPGDPTGMSSATALSPTIPQPRPVDGAWVFGDVTGTGRWFDPPMAGGYTYEVTDGVSKITAVELPTGIGDADNLFVIEDPTNGSTVLAGGMLHTFDVPVDMFTVTGIDPTVDGSDSQAFPTYLEFDQLTVSFTQTPLSVPEPASFLLLGLCGAVLVWNRALKLSR